MTVLLRGSGLCPSHPMPPHPSPSSALLGVPMVPERSTHCTLSSGHCPGTATASASALLSLHLLLQLVAKAFPQPEAVERVVEVASDFWRLHPDKHIAIHCAYGKPWTAVSALDSPASQLTQSCTTACVYVAYARTPLLPAQS